MPGSYLPIVVLLSFYFAVQCQDVDLYPAIAMICGKNTQHRDVNTGEWITDTSGHQDCMEDEAEILEYCRGCYPGLVITGTERQNTSIRVNAWCAIGHAGPTCRGHGHTVHPIKCITGGYSPTLLVKAGCNVITLSDETCKGSSYWSAKAAERCQDEGKVISDGEFSVIPCSSGVNKWKGIEFACCKSNKPVPKLMNIDPICTLPKKTGKCRAAFAVWYFDTTTGACAPFTYGGCDGNDNRFENLDDCQRKCKTGPALMDPLLTMGIGPVILQPESTASPSSRGQSSVSYFDAPLDPNSEPEMYSNALIAELREHQSKLSSLMDQWNTAKAQLLKQGASQDAVDSDLQRELAALQNEHQRKREQLNSAHQARVDATIVGARTNSYNALLAELNKPVVEPSKVVRAFRRYVQSEVRDKHHTEKLLQHLDNDSEEAQTLTDKLSTIQTRVNNALTQAQERVGPGSLSDQLAQLVTDHVGPVSRSPSDILNDNVGVVPPLEDERPMLIDYGGLPPENTDEREEIEGDLSNEDMDDDEYDDEMFSNETPLPLFPEDFPTPMMPDYDLNEFDRPRVPSAAKIFESIRDNYNEQSWLVWVGIAGAALLLLVVLIAVGRHMGTRYNHRRQFARVEVEDQLTPEEKQLLQLQQNGYENPTYKFFEKQQQQA